MLTISYKYKIEYEIKDMSDFISFLSDIKKADHLNINNKPFMEKLFSRYNNQIWTLVKFKQSWGSNFKGKSKFQIIFWETRGFNSIEAELKSKSFSSKAAGNLHDSRAPEERKRIALKANKKRIEQMKDLEKNDPQKFKESLSTTIEFYLAKGMNQTEAEEALKERQSTFSRKKMIEKHGEEEGTKKVEERNKKWFKSLKENNDWDELSKSKAVTLEKSIFKYGEEEGTERFNEWVEARDTSKEGFIKRYGEEKGDQKYIEVNTKKGYGNTLPYHIEKYGEEEGMVKWKERLNKMSVDSGKASKESLKIFLPLLDLYKNKFRCYLGYEDHHEWFIWDNDLRKQRRYDFTLREAKIIIEYNGETFHPNKDKLNESEWNNWVSPFSRKNADKVYHHDREKIKLAEENGFKVLELWSSTSVEENIKIANEFIGENT